MLLPGDKLDTFMLKVLEVQSAVLSPEVWSDEAKNREGPHDALELNPRSF